MDSLRRLEELFAHFPGIGPRQAKRFVYYILNKPTSFIKEFNSLLEEVKKSTSECEKCHRLFFGQKIKGPVCNICSDPNRDQTTLMIVARDSDFETVERSGAYQGLYFILGGTIPLLDKEPEKRVRLNTLIQYIAKHSGLKEVILSLNTTPDGEHTVSVIKEALTKSTQAKISLLGRGLSTGAELEYVDGETIRSALANRG